MTEDDLKGDLNGSLHIFLTNDPDTWRVSGRLLDVGFGDTDWGALFVDELHCPVMSIAAPGRSYAEKLDNYKKEFQRTIPQYPMLGRIWDIYEDVSYSRGEARKLLEECLVLLTTTTSPESVRALRKLVYACTEAQKSGTGLFLASD